MIRRNICNYCPCAARRVPQKERRHGKDGSNNSGFSSGIYEHVDKYGNVDKMAYVIRGTDEGKDWIDNSENALNAASPQYLLGLNNAKRLKAFFDSRNLSMILIGHSLGGGIATLAGLVLQVPTFVFNAAAVSQSLQLALNLENANENNIYNFIVFGEAVSGQVFLGDYRKGHTDYFQGHSWNPITLHGMRAVIKAIEDYHTQLKRQYRYSLNGVK